MVVLPTPLSVEAVPAGVLARKSAWYNRNNRAAAQMVGGQNTQITVVHNAEITVGAGLAGGMVNMNLADLLRLSVMHINMSNVYDQCRVRKITLKFTPTLTPGEGAAATYSYATFFTAMDRNGFAAGITVDQLRTYQSFKQTVYANMQAIGPPTHYVSWANNTLFEKIEILLD